MKSTKNQNQKAKEKARELLKEVGQKLSQKEAVKIAKKADIPIQQVIKVADRRGVEIRTGARNAVNRETQANQEQDSSQQTSNQGSNDQPSNDKQVNNQQSNNQKTDSQQSSPQQKGDQEKGGQQPGEQQGELGRFANPDTGRFGIISYQDAVTSGRSPAEIAYLLSGSGLVVGEKAKQKLAEDLGALSTQAKDAGYWNQEAERISKEADSYREQLSNYSNKFNSIESQYNTLLSQQQTLQSERDAANQRTADLEKQKKEEEDKAYAERESEIAGQVNALRGGYTASGGVGAGIGNLSSGRRLRLGASAGRSGRVLDRVLKGIDPTDSVLDKEVAIGSTKRLAGGSNRAMARQRALTAGGSAQAYYARRFG
jgi:hypothetical protein